MSKTKTETTVRTVVEADLALRTARLSDEEEKVLRMHHGIPLASNAALELRGQDHEATRMALVELEQRALAATQFGVDAGRRSAIIERLRKL